MKRIPRCLFLQASGLLFLAGCGEGPAAPAAESTPNQTPLFTLLPPDSTGVAFVNELTEGPNLNVLMYEYLYNGGGVAAADLNGDGLDDLYFTSNMAANKCFLNQGDMRFLDITERAGIAGREGPWKTGITAADVNGDGRLDLYLCYSGALPPEKRTNQLFINMGNDADGIPQFEEQAEAFGLASAAFSNQGYFFDYDRDGDLDMALLNHNPKSLPILNVAATRQMLDQDDPLQGLRLFRQDNGRFTDVTDQAGINGSALSYGLGLGISDVNADGWPDFYVSNDYAVPDYLYINNGDGTFTDRLQQTLGHTSHFSMGNDIADINNDGLQDIFTLDMLPQDNRRQKLLLSPDNYDKFDLNVRSGFHYQYMRNMLQLNTGTGGFSEIGQLAGVSNTDWSWSALLADYTNDGWKDLFITNGYYRDYTNLDFINYMEDFVAEKGRLLRSDVLEIVQRMPSSLLTNYLYVNQGGASFEDRTRMDGVEQAANSNGAAYSDLDGDGDLDLIVNNINQPAFIYRNNSDPSRHYLQVRLIGGNGNTQGIGAAVTVYAGGLPQKIEQMPTRGYLSTVSTRLHFGLGTHTTADSVHIRWSGGAVQTLREVAANQLLEVRESEAGLADGGQIAPAAYLVEAPGRLAHISPPVAINDFKRQPLLIAQFSHRSPILAAGDLNGDGLEDVVVGGGRGSATSVYLQGLSQRFTQRPEPAFDADRAYADGALELFDANGDGSLDLYAASGGYHDLDAEDPLLQDRLYLGDGKGGFSRAQNALPQLRTSAGCVTSGDINGDGAADLFVGGRVVPGRYPEAPASYLLVNDGKGNFEDRTQSLAPHLSRLGMVSDALWTDVNGDGAQDLAVVGEWMPVVWNINRAGSLARESGTYPGAAAFGWWNCIAESDLNGDGKPDFVLGNMGLNTQFQASEAQPLELFYDDFDDNGAVDPIFTYYIGGQRYPYLTRDELLGQLARYRSRFTSYESYASAALEDIFNESEIREAGHLQANVMKTTVYLSDPAGGYREAALPVQAQYAPVQVIVPADVNADGATDLLLLGNSRHYKLRLGKFDANYGTLLLNDGKGDFEYVPQARAGLSVKGDVQSAARAGNLLLLGLYGDTLKTYPIPENKPEPNEPESAP